MNTFHTRTRPDDSVTQIDNKIGYHGDHIESGNHGLTKRELIAIHLMAGINTNPDGLDNRDMARLAVAQADFLIQALNGEL